MEKKLVDRTVEECNRFLERVKELQQIPLQEYGSSKHYPPGKGTGAVRRASLDLSRALSALRKG